MKCERRTLTFVLNKKCMIEVEIITIGDELLIGQVIDTNSAWIARELNNIGLDVKYKTTVGDNEEDITDAFERAFSRTSVVLVTGGIGPTKDDITKKTLCKFFNTSLVFDEETLKNIEEVVSHMSRALNELTRNQAWVPENAVIIQNKMGTAPVTRFERDGKLLISMPGVPFEMKWVMSEEIIPLLKERFIQRETIIHHTFWVANYPESLLAIRLESFENELPPYIKLAYLPASGLIRLRLTGKYSDEKYLRRQMEEEEGKLIALLDKNIISKGDRPIEMLLFDLLKEKKLTLSVAESCTGGRIAGMITALPGCSEFFNGGVVSYSNESKVNILRVNSEDIDTYGAVSENVVVQMAKGVGKLFFADCSMATSGIAGPDGGTDEKPVGTVWIAVRLGESTAARKYLFGKNRENNILRASNMAMLMLYDLIRNNGPE